MSLPQQLRWSREPRKPGHFVNNDAGKLVWEDPKPKDVQGTALACVKCNGTVGTLLLMEELGLYIHQRCARPRRAPKVPRAALEAGVRPANRVRTLGRLASR